MHWYTFALLIIVSVFAALDVRTLVKCAWHQRDIHWNLPVLFAAEVTLALWLLS